MRKMTFVSKELLFCTVNMAKRNPWRALFAELSREMAEERRAMRDARNGDGDGDGDGDGYDDDDDEETLLSIKMANYQANKRRSSDTKRERERERAVGRRSRLTPLASLRPPKKIS